MTADVATSKIPECTARPTHERIKDVTTNDMPAGVRRKVCLDCGQRWTEGPVEQGADDEGACVVEVVRDGDMQRLAIREVRVNGHEIPYVEKFTLQQIGHGSARVILELLPTQVREIGPEDG